MLSVKGWKIIEMMKVKFEMSDIGGEMEQQSPEKGVKRNDDSTEERKASGKI